jgi:hypothetical protein
MKRICFSFKQSLLMALIAILCLFGCAVIPNYPSQLSPLVSGDTKTDVCPEIAEWYSEKGIASSPAGKLLGYVPLTRMLHDNDSDRAVTLTNADDKQVPINLSLLSVSIRTTIASIDVLGDVALEEFREYGVAANLRLPWAWYSQSGWGTGTRLMAGAGALHGGGETALVVSLIPLVALGSQDGRFTLDMGAGGALLSRYLFGTQDYGGYFQFALTAGVGVPLFERLGVGYRFLHYSDAGINGPHNTGADMHMLELTYRF